jgi:hypothetical protein
MGADEVVSEIWQEALQQIDDGVLVRIWVETLQQLDDEVVRHRRAVDDIIMVRNKQLTLLAAGWQRETADLWIDPAVGQQYLLEEAWEMVGYEE